MKQRQPSGQLVPQLRLVGDAVVQAPVPEATTDVSALLTQYLAHPQDGQGERLFAYALCAATLYVPAQYNQQAESSTLHLTQVTYLADGLAYVPVFFDQGSAKTFIEEAANEQIQTIELKAQEVMTFAQQYGLTGMLIEPMAQSVPLSQPFWQYVQQLVPVIEPDIAAVQLLPDAFDLSQIARTLTGRGLQDPAWRAAWAVPTRLAPDDSLVLTVAVDYSGSRNYFDALEAQHIANLCRPLLPPAVDVVVCHVREALGQLLQSRCQVLEAENEQVG